MKENSILVVEDEMIIAMEIRATLKKLGYKIAGSVINGYDAIQTAGEKRPDLVLMDIRLKGDMDGIDAAKKIMDLYDIPVIFLTGNSDKVTVERAVEIKPAGFLIKPFKERELFGNIEMAIHKHKVKTNTKTTSADKSSDSVAKNLSTIKKALISTDKNGTITRANPTAIDLIGSDKERIIGRNLSDILKNTLHPDKTDQNIPESEFIWPDSVILRKIPDDIPVGLNSGFILNDTHEITDFLYSITSENENKLTFENPEDLLLGIIDAVDEMIFIVNKEMNILKYNKGFLDLSKRLGITSFQLTRPVYEINKMSYLADADEYVEVFRTKTPLVKTKRFKTKGNEINYFQISLIPSIKEDSVNLVTTIIDDVTPIIHAKKHTQYIAESLEDIENSLMDINKKINSIKSPLIEITDASKKNNSPSDQLITEKSEEILAILESFEINRIKYEDAIDHIKYIDKTFENW